MSDTLYVCIRSGPGMIEGLTFCTPDAELFQRFPDHFALSDRPAGVTRNSEPVGVVSIRSSTETQTSPVGASRGRRKPPPAWWLT